MKYSLHNPFIKIKALLKKREAKVLLNFFYLSLYLVTYTIYIVPFLSHLEFYFILFPDSFDSLHISHERMIDLVKAFAFIVATFPLFGFASAFIFRLIPDLMTKKKENEYEQQS